MRFDPDVKAMSLPELRREVMRLRTAFRKELNDRGNRRCWITLLETIEGRRIQPLELSEEDFLVNCRRYYQRNR